jgi:hypothetical protein
VPLRQCVPLLDALAHATSLTADDVAVVEVGFPRPRAAVVRDRSGRFIARVDPTWSDLRPAVEYDGGHHDDPSRIVLDRQRPNALHLCGSSVLVIDRTQLRDEARVVELALGCDVSHLTVPLG